MLLVLLCCVVAFITYEDVFTCLVFVRRPNSLGSNEPLSFDCDRGDGCGEKQGAM
jgi:hypothetical protein